VRKKDLYVVIDTLVDRVRVLEASYPNGFGEKRQIKIDVSDINYRKIISAHDLDGLTLEICNGTVSFSFEPLQRFAREITYDNARLTATYNVGKPPEMFSNEPLGRNYEMPRKKEKKKKIKKETKRERKARLAKRENIGEPDVERYRVSGVEE